MRKVILGVLLAVASAVPASAHLCNDVFVQAKDNLAVKVDIRDGQLRIAEQASFRVYLLNTMDREIVQIDLQVKSAQFNATVTPSPDWKSHPALKHVGGGGKKEFFTVTLTRKPNVPDGKYKIDLRLFNPGDQRDFKALDLEGAADLVSLPKAEGVKVDGSPMREEWQKSPIFTDFYTYGNAGGGYATNRKADAQVRVRMMADETSLYCLLNFQGGEKANSDEVTMYLTPTTDEKPVTITFNRLTGAATCSKEGVVVEAVPSGDKTALECRIPREPLGMKDANAFCANFTRTLAAGNNKVVTYWRGNSFSMLDPIVYGQFRIE